jgi:sulfate permease, SulP family
VNLPIVASLRGYQHAWLSVDIVAGLTVWGLVVPQAMAYASIAGLPAEAGLYTILVSMLAYALFGSSRHLIVSATSATAALVGSTIVLLHPVDAAQYASHAATLVLLVGLLFLLAGAAKLGFIAQFLSRPVMEGFVFGLTIFVAVGQLNKVFGVSKGDGNTFAKLWHVVTQLDEANWWAFAIGAAAMAGLFALPHLSKQLPAGLVVLAGAIVASAALDLAEKHDVAVIGTLPKGLPSLSSPTFELSVLWTLLPAAVGIVLVAYSEALGAAESLATRHGYEIRPNQELMAFGAVNLATGAVGGLVGCGGMSASAVNDGARAKTQISAITATAMALITVVALTPLFKHLPDAVLGALIIHAVSHMMSVAKLKAVYRIAPTEFWLGITALLGVVTLDVLQGLIIAMAASILLVVYRTSKPSVVVLGELAELPGTYGAIERNPGAATVDGVLVLRHDETLYYANASSNRDAIKRLVEAADPAVQTVIFHPEVLHTIDVTSIESLEHLLAWLRQHDIEVFVVHPHRDLLAIARRTSLLDALGDDHVVATVADALARRRGPTEGSAAD